MMKFWLLVLAILSGAGLAHAQEIDVTRLDKIGPVTSYEKTERGITLNCSDNSQVQITILAPDLIRVRASFTRPIPAKDHSWAIAKESWDTPAWTVNESAQSITAATSERSEER